MPFKASLPRLLLAAALLVLPPVRLRAQAAPAPGGLHDSITVTTLTFPGAKRVAVDDLRRGLYTRGSTCRIVLILPLCKLTATQLFTDRRRTTPAALGEDMDKLRVLYWRRGFREAQVDTVIGPPGKRGRPVAFRIVEGEPTVLSSVRVTQRAPVLDSAKLESLVQLHEGEPFDLIALDSTLAHLRTAVWNTGHGDVRIDTSSTRSDGQRRVGLIIDVDPRWITRVGSIGFEGNHYLSDATLRRGVLLTPGALYTRDALLESQRRLFQSPAIARAVVITPPAGDSVKSVTVEVTETPAHHAEVTLGFNTIEFGQAAVELRHNALGAGRWLRLRAVAGNLLGEQLNGRAIFQRAVPTDAGFDGAPFLRPTYQTSLTLTQPWLAGARTSAALTAFAGRRSLVGVAVDEDAGASLGIVRELGTKFPVGLNYRFESTRVQAGAVYFCAGYGVCDAATISALSRMQRLAPIAASAWFDNSDDLEVPTRGYTAVLDAEHASSLTGSSFAHDRIAADGSYYRAIGVPRDDASLPKVLALHGRAGFVRALASDRATLGVGGEGEGILHPRARFYAGGMQSVRGFAENELGPRVLQARRSSLLAAGCTDATIANGQCDPSPVPGNELYARPTGGSSVIEGSAELRVPIVKQLGGVLFVDGAYVGASGLTAATHGKGAITPGAGFRYRSPLGVLRLDFGIRPTGAETLPVVVAVQDAAGERVVRLDREKSYSLLDPSPGFLRSVGRRLVVHFAMGQAF